MKLTTCTMNTFLLGKTSVIFVYFSILCDACLQLWDTKSQRAPASCQAFSSTLLKLQALEAQSEREV